MPYDLKLYEAAGFTAEQAKAYAEAKVSVTTAKQILAEEAGLEAIVADLQIDFHFDEAHADIAHRRREVQERKAKEGLLKGLEEAWWALVNFDAKLKVVSPGYIALWAKLDNLNAELNDPFLSLTRRDELRKHSSFIHSKIQDARHKHAGGRRVDVSAALLTCEDEGALELADDNFLKKVNLEEIREYQEYKELKGSEESENDS